MGISQITFDIADRIWDSVKYAIENNEDEVIVDISDFNLSIISFNTKIEKVKTLTIYINPDKKHASVIIFSLNNNISIYLGTNDNNYYIIKNRLIHEIKHMIDSAFKSKNLLNDTKRFFDGDYFTQLLVDDIKKNNNGELCSIDEFMLKQYDDSVYRKFLIYCYLANDDELSAIFQVFYNKVKTSKNLLNTIKEEENKHPLIYYKQMVNFSFNFDELKKNEKNYILNNIDKKNLKKVEAYIRKQGQLFIKKLHKLAYFQEQYD